MTLSVGALVAFVAALYAWGVWVSRRHAARLFRWSARGPLVGGILLLGGLAWVMRQSSRAFELTASDQALAATRVADSISSAILVAGLPIAIGNLILLASMAAFVVGTVRPPSRGHGP